MRTESFWPRVHRFPPILCRLLARSKPKGPALTNAELARRSGLTEYEVVAISGATSWKGIDVFVLQKFTVACGLDFTSYKSMHRASIYLRGRRHQGARLPVRFTHLRKSPDWQGFFQPLIERYIQSLKQL